MRAQRRLLCLQQMTLLLMCPRQDNTYMNTYIGHFAMCHVMQACGSGGTAAGMALGLHLSGLGCQLHAMGVCDDPDYFYNYMDGLLKGMGANKETTGESRQV